MFGTFAFDRLHHRLSFRAIQAERSQNHLCLPYGRDGDVMVRYSGAAMSITSMCVTLTSLRIRFDGFIAPLRGEGLRLARIARANRLEDRLIFEVEEIFDLREGVRVRPAHEAVTDDADA
jgi:hypothetical protein